MSDTPAAGRYVAAKTITTPGSYYDTTGRWTVSDTRHEPHMPAVFASGRGGAMKRWARDLNARA